MKILVFFGLLPKSDFFCFRISVQRAVGGIRHPAEATLVFVAGPVQSVLRVHTGHLGDLAENEQSVAQLLPDAVHQKGIRDELEQYGIDIISTMDAHFDPALQNMQLESIKMQHPDAVIAIPTDDVQTGPAFQELSKMTRLIFLSNVPQNFSRNNYVSCISVNERENGTNTGRMIGEYLKEKPHAKVGFIIHGAMFYGTTERDNCAEKILRESYPDIEITARKGFIQIENAYKVCYEMINEHPDIQALYVSWDRPALLAIKALKALNRTDIAVFTTDLDFEIAEEMNQGFVKGLSTQRPYDQGKAAALAVAKSLVSDKVPKYIGVQPYVVHEKQLKRAWKDIFFEALPEELG